MTTVSPEVIWEKANQDSEFTDLPKPMQEALKPFIEALPTVLADQLDNRATLVGISKAKVTFLRYCLDNDLAGKIILKMLGHYTKSSSSEMMEASMRQLLDSIDEIVQNAQAILEAQAVSEDEVMRSESVGLNPEALSLYLAGELTIAKLLEVQPMLIAKNT